MKIIVFYIFLCFSVAIEAGTITQSNGTARHATSAPGQTFTMPESGSLISVQITFAARSPYTGVGTLKIYDDPTTRTLLGTSTNTIADTTGGEFSSVTGTFTFSGVSLSATTTYYLELTLNNGAEIYWWEGYTSSTGYGDYSGGKSYERAGASSYDHYDKQFVITYDDQSPPVFQSSTPSASSVGTTTLTLNNTLDEDGTVYYVVVADGATAPSVAEVKGGASYGGVTVVTAGSGATSSNVKAFSVTGLTESTAYDIYVVAQDDESTPNVQTSVSLVNVTTISSDSTSPSVTFAPTSGATDVAVDSNITLTFDEAIRNVDDSALTDSNVDSVVELRLTNSSGTAIAFDATINAGKTVITINPTSSFTEGTTIYVALKASSVEDSSDNAASATSITFSVVLSDPTTKADVKGTVNTMSQAAIQFVRTHSLTVNNRLNWLQRRNGNQNTSYQGIKVSVNGHEVGQSSRLWNQWMSNTGDDALYSNLLSLNDAFTNQSFKVAMMDAAYETLLSLVDTNPTGGKFMDSYSVWTDGQISFGDSKASGQSSDLHGFNLAMGIDKLDEDNELMGIALNYAEGDAKINSSGSKTASQSISLSLYAQQHLTDELDVQGQLGVGLMNFDSRRIDDSQTLTGDRDGKMLFAAIALTPYDALRYNNMFIKPYGRGEYSHIKLDDYAESGGSNALNYKDQHINRYMIFAGSEIYLDMNVMGGQFKPFVGFEYGLDLTGDSKVGMYYVSNSSTQYQLTQKAVARSNVMVKVGTDYTALNGIISTASFQSEEALGSRSYYTFALNITIPLN